MVVQHNISAMTANRYYGINNKGLAGSLEKLASGYAINKAGDNAAGLAVSEKMRAQIGGLTQASKNAEDGISLVQTFEGALQETDSILQRMRTLAVQSANGSYQNDVDRDAIQLEYDQLNDELNQIADTDFNGVVMLNGGVMADGTVVNDSTKVAKRPTINDVNATPNPTFTYSSSANGTVDGGGNGTINVNGVSMELSNGQGTGTLGSLSTGLTTYTTNVSVNHGSVNGNIAVNESYSIDSETNRISLHGQSFNIANGQLQDENGNAVGTVDGLNANVDTTNNVVTLSGTYIVADSVVSTPATFSTNVADSSNTENTANIDGAVDKNGNGQITVNGTKLTVIDGQSEVTNGSISGVTYQVTASSLTEASDPSENDKVTGSITADGQLTSGTKTIAKDETGVTAGTSRQAITIGNSTVYLGKSSDDAEKGKIYDAETGGTDITNQLTDGTFCAADKTTYGKVVMDGNNVKSVETFNKVLNYGTEQLVTTSDGKLAASNGDVKDDGSEAYRDGLVISATGAVSGTFDFSDVEVTGEPKEIGSFKISQGVSKSDAFNHGTANLTYADSMTLQVGARGKDAVKFNFSYTTNGIGNLKSDMNASARGLGTDQLKVNTQEDANAAIDQIDNAINKVNMIRATFGSVQNRLEHKINNIDTNTENLTAAESRIRDTQMDKEMMKFTSAQILSQASQSMLAQANSLPQGVLQLLG